MVQGRPNDDSKLSMKPSQIRNRMRRKHAKFSQELDLYVDKVYQKPLDEWDVEELAHGRPRDKSGGFRGKTPVWITAAVQQEAKRRLLDHTFGSMAAYVDSAIDTVHTLMTSDEIDDNGKPIVDARVKLAAATFIIEHVVGKPKAVVEVGEDTTRQALALAIVLDDGMPQGHLTIEGEFEEMEDQADDDSDIAGE